MEIKRASTKKPEFCDEKKPIVKKKKKKSSCPACSGEGHTVNSKEAILIIEREIKQWEQYL